MNEIKIHRKKLSVYIGGKPVRLTREEHYLLTTLGIADNRLVPTDMLLDVMCDGRVQIPADKYVLQNKVRRLRNKIGTETIRNSRDLGYVLLGNVQFVG